MDTGIDHSMFESLHECAGCNVVSLCERAGSYASVQIAIWRVCMLQCCCVQVAMLANIVGVLLGDWPGAVKR